VTCSRLRLAGETLDGIYHLHPYSWDGLFGFPGRRGENVPIIGQPGRYRAAKMAEQRVGTLGLLIRPQDSAGRIITTACQHEEANQDLILSLVGAESLQMLEWDMCDGTMRYLEVEFVDAMPIAHRPSGARELPITYVAPYPAWRGADVVTPITGTVAVNPGGNAPVDDCLLSFSAAGTLTNALTGEAVQIDPGGGGAVTIDCWTGEVTQGGAPAQNRVVSVNSARILHLVPAVANSLTASAGTITVTHRPTWW
jgi:hypothetical protein